jgi:glutathione-regulated potassium-efflux system ancillary protein KefC
MNHGNWLQAPLIFLAAAVVAVPLARALRLGTIVGYLAAGIVIGPEVLGLIHSPETVLELAEFGVVLMLFLVGLELEPRRLWALRRPIFLWGTVQLVGSALLLLAIFTMIGWPWRMGLVAALGLAMSSTAVALAVMAERNLGSTTAGQYVLSISLLQDIAAIPVLALVPVLALGAAREHHTLTAQLLEAGRIVGLMALILIGGRLLLRPALRWIARSKTPEIFTAAALLLVIGTAALMDLVGISKAMGAFLAGVLLAESEYRRELETDLEPFKGLLMGLFFIGVGAGLDLSVLLHEPLTVLLLLVALLTTKTLLLIAMSRWMSIAPAERPVFVILVAQGGEFGFVVFQLAAQSGLIDASLQASLVAAVALSLALTPALLAGAQAWLVPRLSRRHVPDEAQMTEPQQAPVIIAGFGRYGQIVGRLLFANGIGATVLDHDADVIESLTPFGWRVFYGDATRLDLLRTAGAAQARVLVIAVDDIDQSLEIADLAKEHFPQLQLVARARNVTHLYRLREVGVQLIERETFESALNTGRSVLELMGWEPHAARNLAWRFKRHNLEQLEELKALRGDQASLIAAAKAGRTQFETLIKEEQAVRKANKPQRHDWSQADEPDA